MLSADILSGRDRLVSGPFPLSGGAPGVRVGINPGIPALPPEQGQLSGDPVRFGVSDILSFSPLGTATPGTFYLAGDSGQAAVRVTGGSARVRLMVWRGGRLAGAVADAGLPPRHWTSTTWTGTSRRSSASSFLEPQSNRR